MSSPQMIRMLGLASCAAAADENSTPAMIASAIAAPVSCPHVAFICVLPLLGLAKLPHERSRVKRPQETPTSVCEASGAAARLDRRELGQGLGGVGDRATCERLRLHHRLRPSGFVASAG